MDPVFAFYSGPNFNQAPTASYSGRSGGGGGRNSIPVYEGYGFLSNLGNRTSISLMQRNGPQQQQKGAGGCCSRKRRSESTQQQQQPAAKKRRRSQGNGRPKATSISKQTGTGMRRKKQPLRERRRKSKKARASRKLFELFD